jgi:uncharacterized membrane protein
MKKFLFGLSLLCAFIFFCFSFVSPDFAQEEILEAKITEILEEKLPYQKLKLLVTKGSLINQEIIIENGILPMANQPKYKLGDRVVVSFTKNLDGQDIFLITDYVRRNSLLWLFIIFVILTTLIGRWRGLTSLLGMAISFLIIFTFILPKISSGANPILIAIIGSLFIIPATFYLSHGFNMKTTVAIAGTLIALIITGLLAGVFVEAANLTGFASEEAGFLQVATQGEINIKGLLLAGIIIGVLGVLDDITVSQSAIVLQLRKTNPKMKFEELYQRAMDVGQDHISSMVNTLILVYTGAALPLLLLFVDSPHPVSEVINYEIIADEVVRTLVGSIGLILAVPITTLIAALTLEKKTK